MTAQKMCWATLTLALSLILPQSVRAGDKPGAGDQVEPSAGQWRTWVIESGAAYRAPAPPGPAETRAELRRLADIVRANDDQALAKIAYWDAGAPSYRWIDLI